MIAKGAAISDPAVWQAYGVAVLNLGDVPEQTRVEMFERCSENHLKARVWKKRAGTESGEETPLEKFRREVFEEATEP